MCILRRDMSRASRRAAAANLNLVFAIDVGGDDGEGGGRRRRGRRSPSLSFSSSSAAAATRGRWRDADFAYSFRRVPEIRRNREREKQPIIMFRLDPQPTVQHSLNLAATSEFCHFRTLFSSGLYAGGVADPKKYYFAILLAINSSFVLSESGRHSFPSKYFYPFFNGADGRKGGRKGREQSEGRGWVSRINIRSANDPEAN